MRGVGFAVRKGTPTHFENVSDTAWRGSASFNPDADPYDEQGNFDDNDPQVKQQKADRFFGGNLEVAQRAWPAGQGIESEGFNALALMSAYNAGRPTDLPAGGYWLPDPPGDPWDGVPTRRESETLSYITGSREHVFYRKYVVDELAGKPGFGEGWSPERPSNADIDYSSEVGPENAGRLYFVSLHPQYGTPVYFRNSRVDQAVTTYSDAYNQSGGRYVERGGKRVPAYPHVFGEPGQAPTPAPPKPEPPKPEPPKPEPPKPTPPPASDPLAPFFTLAREWPRGLGQRAAVRQFLDWASPKVVGDPMEALRSLEMALSQWPDNRKDVVKAYLAFVRGKIGGAPPVPEPAPPPVPTPPGEGLTIYRKDGEIWSSVLNPRGVVEIPIPRTLRLRQLRVEFDFVRGPQPTNKNVGPEGKPRESLALITEIKAKGTVRAFNRIGVINTAKDFLKVQTKVDIPKASGFEDDKIPAILAPVPHHLAYVYDAGDRATVTIGPHTLSVKSTARNGILEIPKGNLSVEFGHDPSVDGNPGTPEATSPPGWMAGNLVVTGVE